MKGVVFRSDYSNDNTLTIIQKDDGDIVVSTWIRDPHDSGVEIATFQGGTRLKKSAEIIKHFSAIIDLLKENGNDEITRVL